MPQPDSTSESDEIRYFSEDSDLVDRTGMSSRDVAECIEVMEALRSWRNADRALSDASQKYMKLNETDMRAIRMLVRARESSRVVTPKDIATHVGISSASTTKLIDRLEAAGHVRRTPHPHDRRTMCITVTDETRLAARESVGRQHARRFAVAARLSASERDVVIRFLSGLAAADVPAGDLVRDAVPRRGD